jgi:hypothetical protein
MLDQCLPRIDIGYIQPNVFGKMIHNYIQPNQLHLEKSVTYNLTVSVSYPKLSAGVMLSWSTVIWLEMLNQRLELVYHGYP